MVKEQTLRDKLIRKFGLMEAEEIFALFLQETDKVKPLGADSPIVKKISMKYFGTTVATSQINEYLRASHQNVIDQIKERMG